MNGHDGKENDPEEEPSPFALPPSDNNDDENAAESKQMPRNDGNSNSNSNNNSMQLTGFRESGGASSDKTDDNNLKTKPCRTVENGTRIATEILVTSSGVEGTDRSSTSNNAFDNKKEEESDAKKELSSNMIHDTINNGGYTHVSSSLSASLEEERKEETSDDTPHVVSPPELTVALPRVLPQVSSPPELQRSNTKPDPPPSVVDYEEERDELDDSISQEHSLPNGDGKQDKQAPFLVVDATHLLPPPSVTSASLPPVDETTFTHQQHPPDPPPSVVGPEDGDYQEQDHFLDQSMCDEDELFNENENRGGSHFLHAAQPPPTSVLLRNTNTNTPSSPTLPSVVEEILPPPTVPLTATMTTTASAAAEHAQQHYHTSVEGGGGGGGGGSSISLSSHRAPSSDKHPILSPAQLRSAAAMQHGAFVAPPSPPLYPPPHHSELVTSSSFGQQQQLMRQSSFGRQPFPTSIMMMQGRIAPAPPGGRRKIRLRMQEDPPAEAFAAGGRQDQGYRPGFLRSIRTQSSLMFRSRSNNSNNNASSSNILLGPIAESGQKQRPNEPPKPIDRGTITLSWFEGTSTQELQEHVRKSVARKLKLPKHIHVVHVRVLDESAGDPPEEIVLSPFIPSGSEFLLRFSTRDITKLQNDPLSVGPPISPSAAPSPYPEMSGLSNQQLAHLAKKLDALRPPGREQEGANSTSAGRAETTSKASPARRMKTKRESLGNGEQSQFKQNNTSNNDNEKSPLTGEDDNSSDEDEMMLHSEDPIEARLRQITELLLLDREQAANKQKQSGNANSPTHDKRHVIFVLANYFILFLSLIAVSAEIQARAPAWIEALESQMKSVQNCAADQDALFECVSRGDFAGLMASLMLWLSRSAATRRVFLFGFETPKKLWTVVYESFVTAVCWGFSYIFIRRGMNPDTRERFLQKYWKDAVYGSLAGFNAAFMKHVLKNLIPQEVVEDALRERHLKILSWLPHFGD